MTLLAFEPINTDMKGWLDNGPIGPDRLKFKVTDTVDKMCLQPSGIEALHHHEYYEIVVMLPRNEC